MAAVLFNEIMMYLYVINMAPSTKNKEVNYE